MFTSSFINLPHPLQLPLHSYPLPTDSSLYVCYYNLVITYYRSPRTTSHALPLSLPYPTTFITTQPYCHHHTPITTYYYCIKLYTTTITTTQSKQLLYSLITAQLSQLYPTTITAIAPPLFSHHQHSYTLLPHPRYTPSADNHT